MDDEYIDYSCSTPLERLSRDVETHLRAWHITAGSDRHVSFHRKASNGATTTTTGNPRTPSRDRLKHLHFTPPRSRQPRLQVPSSPVPTQMQFHTPPRNRKDLYALEDKKSGANDEIRLIRSAKIMFVTTPPHSNNVKDRVSIELDLCLWDGPSSGTGAEGANASSGMNGVFDRANTNFLDQNPNKLSLSLTSNCKDPFPKYNILSNLSSLFSIGQHLTLSPSSTSSIEALIEPTIQALEEANHPSGKKGQRRGGNIHISVSEAFRNLGRSKDRIEDEVALHTAALKSLSGMLQMAMNIATSNCDSRIPAFGIWGHYKPNNLNSNISDEKRNENDGHETLAQSVMEVPHWMNGGDLFNLASESSVCCIFRKHLESTRMDDDEEEEDDIEGSNGDDDSSDSDDNDDDSDSDSVVEVKRNSMTPSRKKPSTALDISKHLTPPRNPNSAKPSKKQNRLFLPAFLTGKCHPGGSYFATGAEFAVHVCPPGVSYPVHCTTLNSLGQLLLQHCPLPSCQSSSSGRKNAKKKSRRTSNLHKNVGSSQDNARKVVISGARHKYTWSKLFQFSEDVIKNQEDLLITSPYSYRYKIGWENFCMMTYGLSWRNSANSHLTNQNEHSCDDVNTITPSTAAYRKDCQSHVLKILYRALCGAKSKRSRRGLAARKKMEPLWGPYEDPISLVSVDVTWSSDNDDPNKSHLLTLPLRIRSQNTMSSHDVLEMENTILSTVFNPLSVASRNFRIGATYDTDAACTTLSATNRCLLASLIRVCCLDQSHLMGHLVNSNILEQLHQRDELDLVADDIMNGANVSSMTRNLVDAMEWGGMADAVDDDAAIHDTRMQEIVEQLYVLCADVEQFPNPPEEIFDDSRCDEENVFGFSSSHLPKASRPGRLLSILFTSMSGLQTPSSMAALWIAFTSDLRLRWERRESLPNLGRIPGLDRDDFFRTQKRQNGHTTRNVTNGIGSKAKNAAFVHSTEADPDLNDCIINQKLQVFNIGMETIISAEIKKLEKEQTERRHREFDVSEESKNDNKYSSFNGPAPQSVEQGKHNNFDDVMFSRKNTLTKDDDFFDAVGSIDDVDAATIHDISVNNENVLGNGLTSNPGLRRGARCPLHSASLKASSDQMFAPYVQRDTPLTDDLIIERRNMFSRTGTDNSTINSRIEAAHRLQKKKLNSDMSAFKAANPGCTFEDFIQWYGNPEDPLNQYDEETPSIQTASSMHGRTSPPKSPEDEAFEAFYILDATRMFWSKCWKESNSIAAEDQEPLFDAFSSVEMLLLWFDSIHPAILMNQVLGVNIAMANFILQTSSPRINLRPVKEALMRLENMTADALLLLNKDVIKSMSNPISSPFSSEFIDPFAYISVETIKACEMVITYIGSVEVLLSRATSLLTKLNGDEEMVKLILEAPENRISEAHSSLSRSGILEEINSQQKRNSGQASGMNELPFPSVREYVLRNLDEQNPCQLTTCIGGTFGLESGGANSTKGGLVLAMKKCVKEIS